jgi:hypothetical protein
MIAAITPETTITALPIFAITGIVVWWMLRDGRHR